jgi:fatty acid desaturase
VSKFEPISAARAEAGKWHGALLLAWQLIISGLAIFLSCRDSLPLWLLGQILLGLCMMQWFILEHDLGHRALVKNRHLSTFFGHIASVFCLLPYFCWQRVHDAHHRWTGWRAQDPTIPDRGYHDFSPRGAAALNFCWRYWVPVIALLFSIQTFWNLGRLERLFPGTASRRRHLFSVAFLALVYLALVLVFRGLFLQCWLLAFLIFLSISDPYLLSQHTHIDYLDHEGVVPTPVPFAEQARFSRTVHYPRWFERFILYGSNHHGLHHRHPTIPCYQLASCDEQPRNGIWWSKWLALAKSMPARELIFLSTRDTGVDLTGTLSSSAD